jgi:hypothetical protein
MIKESHQVALLAYPLMCSVGDPYGVLRPVIQRSACRVTEFKHRQRECRPLWIADAGMQIYAAYNAVCIELDIYMSKLPCSRERANGYRCP